MKTIYIAARSSIKSYHILFVLVSIVLISSCNSNENGRAGNEKEGSAVNKYPAFPNTIVIKKFKEVTFDLSFQKEDRGLQAVCFAELADGKMYSVIMYDMQSFGGSFGWRVDRYLPFGPGIPVPHPQGIAYRPDSAEVKRVAFILRKMKDNADISKWRFFEYPSQDWSNPVKIPVMESLPLCADSPRTKDYPSYLSESSKLAGELSTER